MSSCKPACGLSETAEPHEKGCATAVSSNSRSCKGCQCPWFMHKWGAPFTNGKWVSLVMMYQCTESPHKACIRTCKCICSKGANHNKNSFALYAHTASIILRESVAQIAHKKNLGGCVPACLSKGLHMCKSSCLVTAGAVVLEGLQNLPILLADWMSVQVSVKLEDQQSLRYCNTSQIVPSL